MTEFVSFGYWVRRRRKALDITQAQLALMVGCAEVTIQKIEADERRPSRQIAALLAEQLQIPAAEQPRFLQAARGTVVEQPDLSLSVQGSTLPIPATIPHNLPVELTSFIGRVRELATTGALLAASRLLTLTGPGGTGKTRLALQLAASVRAGFPGGVWLVELANLADALLIPQVIGRALGLYEEADRPLQETLIAYLRTRHLLLVLDNCEHLIDACATLVETLLQACPGLHILASSREPLGSSGEVVFRVPALHVPAAQSVPLDELLQFEAIQLFVERSRNTEPRFQLTAVNAPAVAQICRRLDGIPLAIELAAARTRLLTVEQIAARLDDRFRLLTGGSRTALPRHQTLRALIDWSYELLSEDERVLLCRLGIFVGGWNLEAAEAVCADAAIPDPLGALAHLVDKSLVQVELQGELARYRMLETIRQYALEKLAASGEADALRHRHAQYYLAFAEESDRLIANETLWLKHIALEHDNFRAALHWAFEQPESDLALQLARQLGWFWYRSGHWNEGRSWLERLLSRPVVRHTTQYAALLALQGYFAWHQDSSASGEAFLQESVALFRALGDREGSINALIWLMVLAREQGDAQRATGLYEELVAINEAFPDQERSAWLLTTMAEVAVLQEDAERASVLLEESLALFRALEVKPGIGWTLNHLGHVAQLRGDLARAAALHRESLPLFREADQQGVAWGLESLGEIALASGDLAAAQAFFAESMQIAQQLSYKPCIAWCLTGLGSVAAHADRPEQAALLWGAAEALRERVGCRAAPAAHRCYEAARSHALAALGEAQFLAAWERGRTLPYQQVIALTSA